MMIRTAGRTVLYLTAAFGVGSMVALGIQWLADKARGFGDYDQQDNQPANWIG